MNNILSLVCLGGFLLLPFAVLLLRAFRRKFMPWWLAFLAVAALGWLLVNGTVYFSFAHLGGLIHSYGDNPPADLVADWADDGAKRVFALFFGWGYALVSFVPLLLIYRLIQLLGPHSVVRALLALSHETTRVVTALPDGCLQACRVIPRD